MLVLKNIAVIIPVHELIVQGGKVGKQCYEGYNENCIVFSFSIILHNNL